MVLRTNKFCAHLRLNIDTTENRPIERYHELARITVLNGLHNIYFREAI